MRNAGHNENLNSIQSLLLSCPASLSSPRLPFPSSHRLSLLLLVPVYRPVQSLRLLQIASHCVLKEKPINSDIEYDVLARQLVSQSITFFLI